MSEVNVPKFPEFRELRIEDREILQACLDRLPPETADQNFTSLFMWRHNYNVKISWLNGCVCLHCTALEGEFFFPPVGKRMLESAETCLTFLREQAKEPIIGRASESLVKRCFADRTRFSVKEDRDSSEYVYLTEHLITLAGRRYHGQRNHIRKFKRMYPDFSLELIGPENGNVAECLELAEEWFAAKWRAILERSDSSPEALAYEQAFLKDERVAIKEIFSYFQELHVTGLAIRVDGRIRAFSVGEPLNEDTVVIHLEKADHAYRGLSQFICQAFCEHVWTDYKFINREEDLGFGGLRRAKLALGPHHLAQKYDVTWA
jgi:hypothetical protein